MVSKHLGINSLKETVMNAKLSNLSELANILSVKSEIRANILALFSRFGMGQPDYETMGELFAVMEDDVAALTLWWRMLECIRHLLNALCRHLASPSMNLQRAS